MTRVNVHDELIKELSHLTLREKSLKRELDNNFYNQNEKKRLFNELNSVKKDIRKVRFKLKLDKELKDEKFR